MSLILGVHVKKKSDVIDDNKTYTVSDAIERDLNAHDLNACQIFTHGPRFHNPISMNTALVREKTHNIDLSVHSAYYTVSIMSINQENKNESENIKKLKKIEDQIKKTSEIGGWGLVLHLVKKYTPQQVADAMEVIIPIAEKYNIMILLEMVASRSNKNTYETPEKINNLNQLLFNKFDSSNWGWCVDTAHIWCSGTNIQTYEQMQNWLNGLENPERIEMFHLNGSSTPQGNGKDIHEIVFGPSDNIWKDIEPNNSGVKSVVEFAVQNNITIICEINRAPDDGISVFNHVDNSIKKIKKLAFNS